MDLQYLTARPEQFISDLQHQVIAGTSIRVQMGNTLYLVVGAEVICMENGIRGFVF